MWLLFPSLAWAARCDTTSAKDLQDAVVAGEVAFGNMDDEAFAKDMSAAHDALDCLAEPLEPTLAGGVHRLEALDAFLHRDHDRAIAHFRALLDVEPGYALNESTAPLGHPLRDDFEMAGGFSAGPPTLLPIAEGAAYRVDGTPATMAPSDRPYILQTFDGSGAVVATRIVLPDQAAWASKPELGPPALRAHVHIDPLPLAVTAGVSAVLAGTFYALAAHTENEFSDPATPYDDLPALRRETNTFAYLALGLGGVAVGTGTVAVIAGTFD